MMYEEGEVFTINWRVIGNENPAEIAYYHQKVDVFLHQWEDTGEWCLMTDQDWLDEHENGKTSANAEYARFHVDGTPVDPDDIYAHIRVDPSRNE